MKQLLLLIGLVILVSSCKKTIEVNLVDKKQCWVCTMVDTGYQTQQVVTVNDTLCDMTEDEIKEFEKKNTFTVQTVGELKTTCKSR